MTPPTSSATNSARIGSPEAIPPLSSVSKWIENLKLALIVLLLSLIVAVKLLPSSHHRPPQGEVVLAISLMGVAITAVATGGLAWRSRFRKQIHESVVAGNAEEISGDARIERHRKLIHSTVYIYSSFGALLSLQLLERIESIFYFPTWSVVAIDIVVIAISIAAISKLKPRIDADHDTYLKQFHGEIGRIVGLVSAAPMDHLDENPDDPSPATRPTHGARQVNLLHFQVVSRVLDQGSRGAGFY